MIRAMINRWNDFILNHRLEREALLSGHKALCRVKGHSPVAGECVWCGTTCEVPA